MIRGHVAAAVLALLVGVALPVAATSSDVSSPGSAAVRPAHLVASAADRTTPVTYRPPVTPMTVVTPFRPPTTRYGSGHLGVDLASSPVAQVRTAGDGLVSFAGQVAGRSLVVVTHADGIRTEYEPLKPSVRVGQKVSAGQVIGVIDGLHRGCAGVCLHWGARRGEVYLDPLSLLVRLGPVRLLPWHDT